MPKKESNTPSSHTRAAFSSFCKLSSWGTKKIPVVSILIDVACDRVEAKWRYQEVRPHVIRALNEHGNDYEHPTVKFLIDEIVKTAAYGAQRLKFEEKYVKGKRLHLLPEDPLSLNSVYW